MKQSRYKGELNSPIDIVPPPLAFWGPVTDKTRDEYEAAVARQESEFQELLVDIQERRIRQLAEHFGIDPNLEAEALWPRLAIRLASEHVPGFRLRTGRSGWPKLWPDERLNDLRITVEQVKRKLGCTDRDAFKFIATDDEYSAKWGKPGASKEELRKWIESLESRLQDAKRRDRHIKSLIEALRK